MKYFSYSPDVGFDLWRTAEEAQKAATESLEEYRAESVDGWNDEVEQVCWGEIKEMAVITDKRPPEEGEGDFDYICDYVLSEIAG